MTFSVLALDWEGACQQTCDSCWWQRNSRIRNPGLNSSSERVPAMIISCLFPCISISPHPTYLALPTLLPKQLPSPI